MGTARPSETQEPSRVCLAIHPDQPSRASATHLALHLVAHHVRPLLQKLLPQHLYTYARECVGSESRAAASATDGSESCHSTTQPHSPVSSVPEPRPKLTVPFTASVNRGSSPSRACRRNWEKESEYR